MGNPQKCRISTHSDYQYAYIHTIGTVVELWGFLMIISRETSKDIFGERSNKKANVCGTSKTSQG